MLGLTRCTLHLSDLIHRHSVFVHHHTPLPLPSQASPGIAIMEILSLSSSIFISKTETCQTCISFVEKQHQSGSSTNLIIHLPQVNQTALYPSLYVHYCLIPSPMCHQAQTFPKASDRKRDQGSPIIKSKWKNILTAQKCNTE